MKLSIPENFKNKVERAKRKAVSGLISGKLGTIQRRALAGNYYLMIKKLGYEPVSPKRIELLFLGRAEELTEAELTTIGLVLKQFGKKDLDVPLFVEECKRGEYRKP